MQIQLRVSDQSEPEKTATGKVMVTIERDQKEPRFENSPYAADVNENAAVESIVNPKPSGVRARDDDIKGKLQYELVGQYPATDFFKINPETGELKIKQDLKRDSLRSAQYIVSL